MRQWCPCGEEEGVRYSCGWAEDDIVSNGGKDGQTAQAHACPHEPTCRAISELEKKWTEWRERRRDWPRQSVTHRTHVPTGEPAMTGGSSVLLKLLISVESSSELVLSERPRCYHSRAG